MKFNKLKSFLVLFLLIFCLMVSQNTIVFAQEEVFESNIDENELTDFVDENNDFADIPASQLILRRERLIAEIEDQHKQLLSQLSIYQDDERNFKVAHDQYQKLQTLNSIEGVVESAKKLVLSRNIALNSYLNLLRLKIIESQGIELFHKERSVEQLVSLQEQLQHHSRKMEGAVNREDVNQLALEFEPLSQSITQTSYYALSILTVGRLQSVYDQSVVINSKILETQSTQVMAESTNRARSLAEIENLIENTPPLFLEMWAEINQAEGKMSGYESVYREINRKLNTIFARLSRLVAYFEELENIR